MVSFLFLNDMSNANLPYGVTWLSDDRFDVMVDRPCSYECLFLSVFGVSLMLLDEALSFWFETSICLLSFFSEEEGPIYSSYS